MVKETTEKARKARARERVSRGETLYPARKVKARVLQRVKEKVTRGVAQCLGTPEMDGPVLDVA